MPERNPSATRILTSTGAFFVGFVFAGLSTAGAWHLLARVVPSDEEAISLEDWNQTRNDQANFFFEIKEPSGKASRLPVPAEAWSDRFRLSRSEDLRLSRSRLGGLPVTLTDYDDIVSDLIPKGGILQQLLSDEADVVEEKEPRATYDLLLPVGGAVLTAGFGLAIWSFVVFRLGKVLRKGKARAEAAIFAIGSIAGGVVIFLWLG